MPEASVASCSNVAVLTYSNEAKEWVPSGPNTGASKVQLYYNDESGAYRVVSRNLETKEVLFVLKGTLSSTRCTASWHLQQCDWHPSLPKEKKSTSNLPVQKKRRKKQRG